MMDQEVSPRAPAALKQAAGPYPFYFDAEDPVGVELLAPSIFQLAHANRFAGAFGRYSVACHSLACEAFARERFGVTDRDTLYACLMHDLHEAMCGDVVAPLKRLCPDYRAIENAVASRYAEGLMIDVYAHADRVREVDLWALEAERNTFSSDYSIDWATPYQGVCTDVVPGNLLALDANPDTIAWAMAVGVARLAPLPILVDLALLRAKVSFAPERTITRHTARLLERHNVIRRELSDRATAKIREICSRDGGRLAYDIRRSRGESALEVIVED